MNVRSLMLVLGLAGLTCSSGQAARFTPEKLRLPSAGMVGIDAAGAAALLSRRVLPPPVVGPAPVRKLRFVRSSAQAR
jgi:hypothetical protein